MKRVASRGVLVAAALAVACGSPEPPPTIGYRTARDADRNKQLLLRDFNPRPMLRAAVTTVERARFPVVDVHNHIGDAEGIGFKMSPTALVDRMNAVNVRTIVILTGQWGGTLQRVVDTLVRPFPGRFVVFTQIDWRTIDRPTFATDAVRSIEDAVRRGARGLKVLKDLGLEVRDGSGRLVTVDDPRLDPIWSACGRLGIPVAIHTSDPAAFFEPIDGRNERYEELIEHPDWSFARPGLPSKQALLDARDRVFAKHPGTRFLALHVANWPENLDYVSQLLEKFPNVDIEISARQAELGRQPRRARRLFLEYPDRILFGTDQTPEVPMYQNYFRFLETADEAFPYWGSPHQGRWTISGLDLPDDVLEKVYHGNADRLLAGAHR